VDWWEWGESAFVEARSRDVPLLISIGYAACHWCHVMAHESFEDTETAAAMNAGFVCVKVDREELPGVDAVYMTATQAMTGQGGWPMTVFATPDGNPFHCGTYFPPTPRGSMPGFRQVLDAVSAAWRDRRDEIIAGGARIVEELSRVAGAEGAKQGGGAPDADMLDEAFRSLVNEFDELRGGFGHAPKFPPSMTLEQLLRHHARTGDNTALGMVRRTCEAMARGGIYDQLGGGFARYSVDAAWVVPHFEKMLYDNALLLRVYLHLYRATGDAAARRVANETLDFLLRELRTAEGGFASSLDADSEGEEGRFYVWTPDQLVEALGQDDGEWAARRLGVTETGTFEHGTSVLRLVGTSAAPDDQDEAERFADIRRRLFAARERRVRPGRDDKIVAAWNGLALSALAESAVLLDRPDATEAANDLADLLLRVHVVDGRLRRTSLAGVVGEYAGVLDDYGCVAEGLLALYATTGNARWFEAAGTLLDTARWHFLDASGQWHDTADDASQPLYRPADPADNATPSGASAVAAALVGYAAYTGSAEHRADAERALRGAAALARQAPRFAGAGLAVAEALLDGPREVAVIGPVDDPNTGALHRVALSGTAPGLVVALGEVPDGSAPSSPLLRDRGTVAGRPAAYVCRGFVCDAPTTEQAVLAVAVGARRD
jgi:uncharacterized protein YyaL (SSP411 family)